MSKDTTTTTTLDVIIIGAGLSGLKCAEEILLADASLTVKVLEAYDRCGGRTKTETIGSKGWKIDSGGMWLGPDHVEMLRLCERFGIATVEQYYEKGKHVLTRGEKVRKTYKGEIPPHSLLSLLELQFSLIGTVDRMAKSVPLEDPTRCPHAALWDAHSVASFCETFLWTEAAKESVNLVCEATCGCAASQVSFLYFLYVVHSAGGIRPLVDAKGGAQDRRMVGGAQQVSERLAQEMAAIYPASFSLERSARVVRVKARSVSEDDEDDGGDADKEIEVEIESGRTFRARRLVSSACPSNFLSLTAFEPRLPNDMECFASRTFRGAYSKAIVLFKRPFWRDAGYSGFCTNTKPSLENPVAFCYDYCTDDYHGLACFFVGDVAVQIASESESSRRAKVLHSIRLFFLDAPREFLDEVKHYHEYLWHLDPVMRGCPSTIYPPGNFCEYNPRKVALPLGMRSVGGTAAAAAATSLLFFTGTDVSIEWTGYMEGAVRSGMATARAVVESLAQSHGRTGSARKKTTTTTKRKQKKNKTSSANWIRVGDASLQKPRKASGKGAALSLLHVLEDSAVLLIVLFAACLVGFAWGRFSIEVFR